MDLSASRIGTNVEVVNDLVSAVKPQLLKCVARMLALKAVGALV